MGRASAQLSPPALTLSGRLRTIVIVLHTHTYCSRQSHQYILCSDDARFFNHSDTPNTESREVDGEDEVITVAKRDIQPGEELTDDYRMFEAHVVDL